jgi:hypothetical protein
MKTSVAHSAAALAFPALAALGGAFAVFSGFDDAPGGVLLGFLLISGAMALSFWASQRRN